MLMNCSTEISVTVGGGSLLLSCMEMHEKKGPGVKMVRYCFQDHFIKQSPTKYTVSLYMKSAGIRKAKGASCA